MRRSEGVSALATGAAGAGRCAGLAGGRRHPAGGGGRACRLELPTARHPRLLHAAPAEGGAQ